MPDDDTRFAPPSAADDAPLDNLAEEMEAFADEIDASASDTEAEAVTDTPPDEPEIRIKAADAPLDVDGALDAVAGLDDLVAAQEAEAHAEQERLEVEARLQQAEEARIADIIEKPLPAPTRLTLRRGSIASVLPGAALVGVGIWLAVAYTTGTAPAPLMTTGVLAGVGVLALVSAWLASGRWQQGVLLLALWGALSVGVGTYTLLTFGVAMLPAALLMAAGASFVLTALLARPVSGKHALPGVLLLMAGVAAAVGVLGLIPAAVLDVFGAVWIPVAVIVAILLLLPVVVRR